MYFSGYRRPSRSKIVVRQRDVVSAPITHRQVEIAVAEVDVPRRDHLGRRVADDAEVVVVDTAVAVVHNPRT